MSIRDYQNDAANLLRRRLDVDVSIEWAAMSGERGLYSPRLDLAVGPFATENQRRHNDFDQLQFQHQRFLRALHRHHRNNIREICGVETCSLDEAWSRNRNARCFLGIEIENQVSRKHLMGGAINASALGRLGLAIGWTDRNVQAFGRLWMYLRFLSSVGKNGFDTTNLLILSSHQFISECRRQRYTA
jgi:hypothetical protein